MASYIKYRSGIIENVMVTYFAKRNNVNSDVNLRDKLGVCKGFPGYEEFIKIKDGILYYDGERIQLDEFLNNGNIKKVEIYQKKENKDFMINIDEIDIEML